MLLVNKLFCVKTQIWIFFLSSRKPITSLKLCISKATDSHKDLMLTTDLTSRKTKKISFYIDAGHGST